MKRLLVDAGNSRVKWAAAEDGVLGAMRVAPPAAALDAMLADGPFDEAVVVDVADAVYPGLADRLPTRRFTSNAAACGVRNGYEAPGRLGADRWAALIGARQCVADAACIVDAGTALTVDLLAADGRHLGGWIAPGLRLNVTALGAGTRGVRADAADQSGRGPGTDTVSAVAGGSVLAVTGLVAGALDRAREVLGTEPVLVVTGGDARVIADAFPAAMMVDDLVLRGLAIWAERSA